MVYGVWCMVYFYANIMFANIIYVNICMQIKLDLPSLCEHVEITQAQFKAAKTLFEVC
jgi:hypothetical protein